LPNNQSQADVLTFEASGCARSLDETAIQYTPGLLIAVAVSAHRRMAPAFPTTLAPFFDPPNHDEMI
jgi:hypothetical protein